MFTKKNTEKSQLQEAIDSAHTDLSALTAETEDYATVVSQLVKLYELKQTEKSWLDRIDPNTAVNAVASVLGVALIVEFERVGILTSKAVGFVAKLK